MKKKPIHIKRDSRNHLAIPKEEQWLYDPKNKAIVDELKRALRQKADREIDLDAFEKE